MLRSHSVLSASYSLNLTTCAILIVSYLPWESCIGMADAASRRMCASRNATFWSFLKKLFPTYQPRGDPHSSCFRCPLREDLLLYAPRGQLGSLPLHHKMTATIFEQHLRILKVVGPTMLEMHCACLCGGDDPLAHVSSAILLLLHQLGGVAGSVVRFSPAF